MITRTMVAARRAAELQEARRNPPAVTPKQMWPQWDFVVGPKDADPGLTARAAKAMRMRRAELIARPLDRIWLELAAAALEVD